MGALFANGRRAGNRGCLWTRSRPHRPDEPSLKAEAPRSIRASFDRMIDDWFPLTYVLNNLNRGLGLPDGYPFVLSAPVIEKLRFVHETINRA